MKEPSSSLQPQPVNLPPLTFPLGNRFKVTAEAVSIKGRVYKSKYASLHSQSGWHNNLVIFNTSLCAMNVPMILIAKQYLDVECVNLDAISAS